MPISSNVYQEKSVMFTTERPIQTFNDLIFIVSKASPFFIPPTRVHFTPSRFTSTWTLSIKLLVESPAFHIANGMWLFSQHITAKANLLRTLSSTQSNFPLKSFFTKVYMMELSLLAAFPPIVLIFSIVWSQFGCMMHKSDLMRTRTSGETLHSCILRFAWT